jgi:hypothetical protein
MEDVRRFGAAVVLTLALGLPALAGNISTGKTDPPPVPASATTEAGTGANAAGNISTGVSEEAAPGESVVEVALSLLRSTLSLF